MDLTPEQIEMITELGEIIRHQTFAQERLAEFRRRFPFALPPNLLSMIEDNLKENIQVCYREMNVIHKPADEKRRWFCTKCKTVFAMPVPGGLCDACKMEQRRSSGPDYTQLNAALRRRNEEQIEVPRRNRPAESDESVPAPGALPASNDSPAKSDKVKAAKKSTVRKAKKSKE